MAGASNPARELIDEEFPEIYRPLIPAALRRAYAGADQAYERLEFLNTPSGQFHRGDLIVIAVESEFLKLIRENHLPFEPSWEHYASPTGKHLVMRSRGANITVNQVEYPHKKPRWARFRERFDVPNMEYMFDEWNVEHQDKSKKKHILLLHGHGTLRFSNLSVPHPSENHLIWWTSDLMGVAGEEPIEKARGGGEGPMESPEPELVEEIIKTVRDTK